jgi:ParB-like chromosome segregation protein Spo0J/N6-adenosine-specific RNA methylase IME4
LTDKQRKTQEIGLSGIAVPIDRMRQLRPATVDALVESIRLQGLLQPILIRPREGGLGYFLIAGWHRLEAVKRLKHDVIRCEICEGLDAIEAELAEIDENLIRAELSPAEEALHTTRRKELYELAHPETKQGKAPGAGRGKKKRSQDAQVEQFVRDTAKKTGKGRSTVQRDATRGKKVKVLAKIVGTSLDQGDQLDALAKLPLERQQQLADRAKAGERVDARYEAKKQRRAERERTLGEKIAAGNLALPQELFGVILVDANWGRTVYSTTTGMSRHASNHYVVAGENDEATQDDDIKALAVSSIAAPDCVCGLWCTEPWRGADVLRTWGFRPVAYRTWIKDIVLVGEPSASGMLHKGQMLEVVGAAGTGFWGMDRDEIMLIGVRGKVPCPLPGTQGETAWFARRGEHAQNRAEAHSDKPDVAHEWFERHFPNVPKVELFARRARDGWKRWGAEAPAETSTAEEATRDDMAAMRAAE